jgi:surface antigen
MKRVMFMAALFLCAFSFLSGAQAQAISTHELASSNDPLHLNALGYSASGAVDTTQKPDTAKPPKEKSVPTEKVPTQHIVAEGESLSMIADKYASTWVRLFAKNLQIADPNIIVVGEKITIPLASEQLPDRPLPAIAPPPAPAASANPNNQSYGTTYTARGDSAGNTYFAGNCTWYAKSRRPDLPNSLGNSNEWVGKAQAQGIATGTVPKVGAIGQQGMHVVYVESVNPDGTVTISEMNYQGPGVTSGRTVAAGNFMYIY